MILLHIIFAYACGRHDVPAVDCFTRYGSTPKQQAQFHRYNFAMKAAYVGAIWYMEGWREAVIAGLVIWMIFDPVVALCRAERKHWYYLSTGNQIDRLLLLMGKYAGIYKFIACLVAILWLQLV